MPRDLDRYIEKVEDSLVKLQDIITALRHADRLDPDDEFEVEYGIDSLVKSVKKVGKICERYKPNEVHVERNDAKVKEAKVDAKVTRTSPVVPVSSRANGVSSPQDKARTASPQQKKSPAISQLKQKASPASSKQSKSLQSSYEDLMSPAGTPVKAVVPQSPELVDSGDESDATCDYDKGKHITQEALNEDLDGLMQALDEDDDFGEDDDFDEAALQEIDSVEKSYSEEAEVSIDLTEEEDDTSVDLTVEQEDEDDANQPQDPKYLKVLKQYFGYKKFRPLQWKIINSVLNDKKDNCVVMATGYGKSLCYQYPSVYTGNVTVVVSPLISLMQDQVLALNAVNIEACFLGSAQNETAAVKSRMLSGQYRIVYMTPEFVEVGLSLISTLDERVGLDLIAIDEAHCVSQWGHDFRTAYRGLGVIRKKIPHVPIMALTATATPSVRQDICKSLHIPHATHSSTGFDRDNLYLVVQLKIDQMKDLREELPVKNGQLDLGGSVIIYCPTKKVTEAVTNTVKLLRIPVAMYHAGMTPAARKQAHKQFVDDEVQVVVATIAFGMGIDKPDVRKIIHYGAPRDVESYYQEIGRAGRDGQPSECIAFYGNADFNTHRFLIRESCSAHMQQHKQSMLAKMEQYLSSTKCRRRIILSHFQDSKVNKLPDKPTENCCDNCTKRLAMQARGQGMSGDMELEKDFSQPANDLFNAITVTGSRYGLGVPVMFLRGSNSSKLPDYMQRKTGFGKGKYKSEKWWKAFGRQLLSEGYLKEVAISGGFGASVELTSQAQKWMQKYQMGTAKELKLMPNNEVQREEKENVKVKPTFEAKILPAVQTNKWMSTTELRKQARQAAPTMDPVQVQLQRDLFTKLIAQRNRLSQEKGVPTFVLFNNKSLLDMAKCRPSTMENLLKIEEIAVEKAQKFGADFLKTVVAFCKERGVEMDKMPDQAVLNQKMDAKQEQALLSLSETCRNSYYLFELQGLALDTVAQQRGIQAGTVQNHMADAIRAGLPVDLDRLRVPEKHIKLITDTIRKPPINSDISRLTPIKEQLPDHIGFGAIKIVIAILQRRYGMTETRLDDANEPSTSTPSQRSQLSRSYSSPVTSSQSSASQQQKRKLPVWMNKQKSSSAKKFKKNSLFSR